jgi:hypothetical protein
VDLTTLGASTCLGGALDFAWYHRAPAAGTAHLLRALAARADPVSAPALAEAGVTYRALCGLHTDDAVKADGAPVDGSAAEILAGIARDRHPPGPIARLLRSTPWLPRWPAPPWTREVRAAVDAAAAGRDRVCRADLLLALLAQEDSAAARSLALLDVEREPLRRRLEELHAQAPTTDRLDIEHRPSAWVLGYLLRSGTCDLPGPPDSPAWQLGMVRLIMMRNEELRWQFSAAFPAGARMLLAYAAAYADLAAEAEEFGPGWEACFPIGDALAGRGVTYARARALVRDPGSGRPTPLGFWGVGRMYLGTPFSKAGVAEAIRLLGRRPRGFAAGLEIGLLGALREPAAVRLLTELDVDAGEIRQMLIRRLR